MTPADHAAAAAALLAAEQSGDQIGLLSLKHPDMGMDDAYAVQKALAEASATFADVVRVTYILADRNDWPACWPVTRSYFADVRPASTMLMAGLQDPRMKIEIEVIARIGSAADLSL